MKENSAALTDPLVDLRPEEVGPVAILERDGNGFLLLAHEVLDGLQALGRNRRGLRRG